MATDHDGRAVEIDDRVYRLDTLNGTTRHYGYVNVVCIANGNDVYVTWDDPRLADNMGPADELYVVDECKRVHPHADHDDAREVICDLPAGHEGGHEDHTHQQLGEIVCWEEAPVAVTPSNPENDHAWAVGQFQAWADEQADHQPREHSVPCARCRRGTWNRSAVCDRCELADAMAVRA